MTSNRRRKIAPKQSARYRKKQSLVTLLKQLLHRHGIALLTIIFTALFSAMSLTTQLKAQEMYFIASTTTIDDSKLFSLKMGRTGKNQTKPT